MNFEFEKLLDIASPKLALACAAGTHIDKVTVELCRAGGEKVQYMEFVMSNCMISGYTVIGDGQDAIPLESVGVDYGKIEWRYMQQKRAGGGIAGQIAAGWDLEKNSKA